MAFDEEGHDIHGDKFCTQCGKPPVTTCQNGHAIREDTDEYGIAIRHEFLP